MADNYQEFTHKQIELLKLWKQTPDFFNTLSPHFQAVIKIFLKRYPDLKYGPNNQKLLNYIREQWLLYLSPDA